MNSRSSWWLFGAAVAVFAFIFFFERHLTPPGREGRIPDRLLQGFKPAAVTSLRILRDREKLSLRLERTPTGWMITEPIRYPAQPVQVTAMLDELERLQPQITISPGELASRPKAHSEFGLNDPLAVIVLQQGEQRLELRLASRTLAGDQIYAQAVGQEGIQVIDAALLEMLPRTANDWRDPLLIPLSGVPFDRVEVRPPTRGFELQFDVTNRLWSLTKPWQLRADNPKVGDLLRRLFSIQIQQFVTDDPKADLQSLGLQSSELELAVGRGTNDLLLVRFGKSPPQDASLVYALCLGPTNVVLVPKEAVQLLSTPLPDLRDRRLLTFAPETLDQIEVNADERFLVQRQTNQQWLVTSGASSQPADPLLMRAFLAALSGLQVSAFVKDVVTDFTSYGLEPARRHYALRSAITNGAGVTNIETGRVEFGSLVGERIHARRGGENSVYAVNQDEFNRLPVAGWQLRDLRVWSFSTSQVMRVTVRRQGKTWMIQRNAANGWSLGPGSFGFVDNAAFEEAIFRLGDLRAAGWIARGDEARAPLGFSEDGHRIEIELKGEDKPQILTLDFSDRRPDPYPYAAVKLDGQTWIFEFPPLLYSEFILRHLGAAAVEEAVAPSAPPGKPPAGEAR